MTYREQALLTFPIGTSVGREFVDGEGHLKVFEATVFDYFWNTRTTIGRNLRKGGWTKPSA